MSRFLCTIAGLLHISLSYCQTSVEPFCNRYKTQLQHYLSATATIQCGPENDRWSEFAAPQPGAVVFAGTEDDVSKTVKFANQRNISFLYQSGANGWADTFTLGSGGIIINVSQLKKITFNSAKTQVSFQSGVNIKEIVDAAYANDARVVTGTCNCVSVLGAGLGGGVGRTIGLYGLEADQLVSVTIVDADGNKRNVTAQSDPDLWWALKGAGPNFALVTSAVFKSYPVPQAQNVAWTGAVVFDQSKIEEVVTAINDLKFEPEMQLDFYYTALPPFNIPSVIALPFYIGSEEVAKQKFASILNIGPTLDTTSVIPYNTWNAAGDVFCTFGDRKPAYTVGLKNMDPSAWRNVWNEYNAFITEFPEAYNSTILSECYSTAKAEKIGTAQSSYAFRDIKCYSIAIPWYPNAAIDGNANAWGQKVRSEWSATAGTSGLQSYINFAHGDEPLNSVYGSSLPRLRSLKARYDPRKRFNQWFPL